MDEYEGYSGVGFYEISNLSNQLSCAFRLFFYSCSVWNGKIKWNIKVFCVGKKDQIYGIDIRNRDAGKTSVDVERKDRDRKGRRLSLSVPSVCVMYLSEKSGLSDACV